MLNGKRALAVAVASAAMGLGLGLAKTASADTLYFDDITGDDYVQIPSNYGGFSWDANWHVMSDSYFSSEYGNTYGSPSGEYAAYNGFGVLSVTMGSGVDFDFNGAYFAGWGENDATWFRSATSITVNGYNNGVLVGSASTALSENSYTWLQADLIGVDELRFVSSAAFHWWLMDNFTYNETAGNVVPTPGAAAGGLALLSLGALRRRTA